MQMEHPYVTSYDRELQDEARADQIQSDARISVKLQEAIERGHWPDLTREQCERLLSVLTEAML
jgi:hypothetical protein